VSSARNPFRGHDRLSFVGKEFIVYLFIVHRFNDADADRMMNHQPCQQVAINQNNLVRMALCKFFGGLCEIGSRYENALGGLIRTETAAEISNVGFANSVVRIIFLGLYIDMVKSQLVLIYDAINPAIAGLS
jgi:hypothetical protein